MYIYLKRAFDFIIALSVLILVLPLIILASLVYIINRSENPYFIQERSGLYGKKINIYKLKSMKLINGKKE